MEPTDESPQLGDADVDREALAADGADLAALAEELGVQIDEQSAQGAPVDRWRVVKHHHSAGSILLGAPTDLENKSWRVAYVQTRAADAMIRVHPDVMPLRASRSERRRGLMLRWPETMTTRQVADDFFIDIVNAGHSRWIPDGDGFQAVGVFTEPGVTAFSFGWASSGGHRAVPLDPGDYARVPVTVNSATWATLEPGEHDLHAILTGLDLRTDRPLRLDVSAEQIARHRALSPRHSLQPTERRRMIDAQITQTRAMITAGASLTRIAEAIATAETDREAVTRITQLLDCGEDGAQSIYDSPLRELRAGNAPSLESRIAELTRLRDAL
ncbi:hypothetical protein [Microbacterium abyssi]|uniref:hypothetical protein n=1 Tax=Microbacterium abyssi TaxID=2782166 RepID=UPI0018883E56|nr:hypothetical protein [Microbacterium sp. A18JL241]